MNNEKSMDFTSIDMVLERCNELAKSQQTAISLRGESDPLVEFIGVTLELNKTLLDAIKSQSLSH